MAKETINEKKNACIKRLSKELSIFCKNKSEGITKVVSLAIPTGWGKTRIVIHSLFKNDLETPIVLWPQKPEHINEIWNNLDEWPARIKNVEKNKCKKNVLCAPIQKASEETKMLCINSRFAVNKTVKDKLSSVIENNKGLIFVIDEWHSKGLLDKYRDKYGVSDNNSSENAKKFWRNELLIETKKKINLFVILVSATPLSKTQCMDEDYGKTDDADYESQITESIQLYNELTSVGFENRANGVVRMNNFYNLYSKLVDKKNMALIKYRNEKNALCQKSLKKDLKEWACEYRDLCNKNKDAFTVYYKEQLALSKCEDSKKIAACIDLLKKEKTRKFIVFCVHIKIAEKLCNALDNQGIKTAYLKDQRGKNREEIINSFNNNGKDDFRVIILTDKDSQGISLHSQEPWLIHYELSWNPIRMIQRFGRAWRRLSGEKKVRLTKPIAFYLPHTYSSEEEQVNRLKRRWAVLEKLKSQCKNMKLAPIPFEVAVGIRYTPEPGVFND